MKPDLAGEAANFVLAGAHAATSSAISAAKMSVLAKATKMRRILARDVVFAAWCTRNAAVTLSEMVLVVNQDDMGFERFWIQRLSRLMDGQWNITARDGLSMLQMLNRVL